VLVGNADGVRSTGRLTRSGRSSTFPTIAVPCLPVRVGVDRVRAALTDRPLRHSPKARALLDGATAFAATLHAPSKLGPGEGPEAI